MCRGLQGFRFQEEGDMPRSGCWSCDLCSRLSKWLICPCVRSLSGSIYDQYSFITLFNQTVLTWCTKHETNYYIRYAVELRNASKLNQQVFEIVACWTVAHWHFLSYIQKDVSTSWLNCSAIQHSLARHDVGQSSACSCTIMVDYTNSVFSALTDRYNNS